jgi:uncharacterized membrane protein YraQ (UPF0718 family)
MIALAFTVLLWFGMLVLGGLAWRRRDGTLRAGFRDSLREYRFIIPRLAVGIVGAGFVAAILPPDIVEAALGPSSGLLGIAIAVVCGCAVPGGPVIAYAIGASALLAGAGTPQMLTFITAWLLFSLNRTIVWELPIMGRRFVVARVLLSLPLPFLVGAVLVAAGI